MRKDKDYRDTRFGADVLREALTVARERAAKSREDLNRTLFSVDHDDARWTYDTVDEFLADFRKYRGYAHFWVYGDSFDLDVTYTPRVTRVGMKAPARIDIEAVFEVFEKHVAQSKLPPSPVPTSRPPVVFIGHGRSQAWRDLKDHLHDKHGIVVEAYETGARAGHTIRDVLEDMAAKSTFAVLVMTGEDEQADGAFRARQKRHPRGRSVPRPSRLCARDSPS